ncbi:MAG: hypothetical protein CVV47_03995 [Spirochaetae bacterium HGW-Spirochaetae-3]|jgi:curved DNA-binding protein CbpA|nr:MAG: hypothetical protein CVV47_03995 [Spirochaetae bacterium HGW-Spirochaetae-3]
MANRFISRIEDGEISTEGELKSAFRALAIATHPDLGDADSRGESFIKARAEYEAAVRYLAPKPGTASAGGGGTRGRFDRDLFYADLEGLLKAGFPKLARHDQERRKYARLRLNVRSSLSAWDRREAGGRVAAFDAFERSLLAMKASPDPSRVEPILALVEEMIEYAECGVVPLRASIEIEFAALRATRTEAAVIGFLGTLVGDMDGGPALG